MDINESILQAVLQIEDDAITVINTEKEVLYWNEAAVKTFNIKKEEILGKNITEFFKEKDLVILDVLDNESEVRNRYHQPREDKHVVINSSPIFDRAGNIIGSVSIERDITHVVRLNTNLETTSQELNELRKKVSNVKEQSPFSRLTGNSKQLTDTIHTASKTAKTDATTLILGESGTGKEVCARAIHDASPRSSGPFIPVNCGAIPPALFESELFGYEEGSFTGASKEGKAGKIEAADNGTLFLDEIGELPLDMQVKLLRVLQENKVYRIGDSNGKTLNVRFVAATNQNLVKMMEEKKFRSDLYYRLNVVQLTMPPLRERIDDIPELAKLFLKEYALKYQVPVPEMDESAIDLLLQYTWPGNVRELRNMMERFIILTEKSIITKADIMEYFPHLSSKSQIPAQSPNSLPNEKENIERVLIKDTLIRTGHNKSQAARKLGISRVTLYNKMKKYGIK